ncbi:glycosyltransferase family 39 protein [Candidatus Shapirobacteria bacterium]|nr:glycosyltransferase family 39 protein [Candidatus Shapirobacteria bacterium]
MYLVKTWTVYLWIVVLSTEFLSLFGGINRLNIILVQVLIVVVNLYFSFRKRDYVQLGLIDKLAIGLILLPLLGIALYYPPNNWDSMTYHLPRVMHWIQNENVNFYPTNNKRQLFMGVTAEYVILHWRLLFGSDIFFNFFQFISMLGSVVGCGLIAKELGGGQKIQMVARILTLTLPMGILQATSTQTDYVAAFCLMAFILFGLRREFVLWSVALGIGILTKTTFLIFAFPFGLYFGWKWLQTERRHIFRVIVGTFVIVMLINGPLWSRNFQQFGNIFGPRQMSVVMANNNVEPKYVVSNLMRNIAMNLGLPNDKYNSLVDGVVESAHKLFGLKIDDKVNSFLGEKYKTSFIIHEDIVGNFLIVVLFGVAMLFIRNCSKVVKILNTCIVAGWILFSLFLKWQLSGTRLELPLLVISTPIIAIILGKYLEKKWLLIGLIIVSLPFVAGNMLINWGGWLTLSGSNRQIGREILKLPYVREEKYYMMNPPLYNQHQQVVEAIFSAGVTNVALDIGGDSWEYPLWVMLQKQHPNIRIEYLRDNPKYKYGAVIYDDLDTEEIVDKFKIVSMANYGLVKLLLLKVQ